jgi:hypothetical protein
MTARISATSFLAPFGAIANTRAFQLVGYGAEWSTGMYGVLHDVQRQLQLWCNCRFHATRRTARSMGRRGS